MAKFPRKITLASGLLTAWLAVAVIFAGVFVIVEHDHEHIDAQGHSVPSGDNCHICLEIQIAQRLIQAFGFLGIGLAVMGLILCAHSLTKSQIAFFGISPFALKVKLNC
jgi:hypothetical protein